MNYWIKRKVVNLWIRRTATLNVAVVVVAGVVVVGGGSFVPYSVRYNDTPTPHPTRRSFVRSEDPSQATVCRRHEAVHGVAWFGVLER